MLWNPVRSEPVRRRGATCVFVASLLVVMVGMAALSIDVGMLYHTRSELQRTADAAALAAAWSLLDDDRLAGAPDLSQEIAAARQEAAHYAAANPVLNQAPQLHLNNDNQPDGDVLLGYLNDPTDPAEQMSFSNPNLFNSILVRVRRDASLNGPVELLFARILGVNNSSLSAQAVATFKDGVKGYQVTPTTGNAEMLPFALKLAAWQALLAGTGSTGDGYAWDADAGQVIEGADGILELNLYPGGGDDQLPPGNFGTVDIGPPNNSTADIARQILSGVSADDLAYFGGVLELGPDGTLILEGDTGLSGAVKEQLEAITGAARAIPLFSVVSGPGDNAQFTVVGFAGIRILHVKLTGPMKRKALVIQPSFVVDDAAITGPGSGLSYFVYQPVRIVR